MKRTVSAPSVRWPWLSKMLGVGVGAAVVAYGLTRLQTAFGVTPAGTVLALGILLAGIVVLIADKRAWHRQKQVALDDRCLYVSEYGRCETLVVPLRDVVRVQQRRGHGIRTMTVHLRLRAHPAPCIQFQPKAAGTLAWHEDEVVREIRLLAEHARCLAS
jgi:hypothetical protein